MKRKRFAVEQIVAVLKQAEAGLPVAELIRKVGISEQTFYRWKKVYGSLEVDQVRQLKQLQDENARLKKLVAELTLDKAMLQDVVKKSGKAFAQARDRGLPEAVASGLRTTSLPSDRYCAAGVPLSQLS